MRLRHYRMVGPQPYQGFVTDQALLGDAITTSAFLTGASLDSTIGVFVQNANGLWESETASLGNTNRKFMLSQKTGVATNNGISQMTVKHSAVLVANPMYLRVTKRASVTPVRQLSIVTDWGGFATFPPEGGEFVLTIVDLSKKTGQENPTYSFFANLKPSEVTGTLATDQALVVNKLVAQINDPNNKVYHAWGKLYTAAPTVDGRGITITTDYDNETFNIATSALAQGSTITYTGTAGGSVANRMVLGEGQFESIRDFEREEVVNNGYTFQEQRSEFFNDYPVPNFFACSTCTYTIYSITGKNPYKTIAEKPHVSNGWDINIKVAVAETGPEVISTLLDGVFAGITVETIA